MLAGGQSQRMGQDKTNLLLGGRTLVERASSTLAVIADPVYVVGDLSLDATNLKIIQDKRVGDGGRGSIVGLYSALCAVTTEWIAVVACDLPFISGELLTRMVLIQSEITESATEMHGAILPEQHDGLIQPLCGLYSRRISLPEVERMISGDNWRLQDLSTRINARILKFSDLSDLTNAENLFLNINTPDDYKAAVALEAKMQLSPARKYWT